MKTAARHHCVCVEALEERRLLSTVVVAPIRVIEPSFGQSDAVFTAAMAAPSAQSLTLHYATANGSAKAGANYTATQGSVVIAAGETSATFSVPVLADNVYIPSDYFLVRLSVSGRGNKITGSARATIRDTQAPPTVTLVGTTTAPGTRQHPTTAVIRAALSNPSSQPIAIHYTTGNGTALAGSDFKPSAGEARIRPGALSAKFPVKVVGGASGDLFFDVIATSATNATLQSNTFARVTIVGAAQPPQLPTIAIANAAVAEPDSDPDPSSVLAFTVTLSAVSSDDVAVTYQTIGGTALVGTDFQFAAGTLTIPAGSLTGTIDVPVLDDPGVNSDRTLTLQLSSPVNAAISGSSATGTIIAGSSGTTLPALSIAGATVTEPASGTTDLPFTVTLSQVSASPVTVAYATANGTAMAETEYQPASGTLTFSPGTTSQTIDVAVNGGIAGDSSKTFTVNLSEPGGASIAAGSATGTIDDDITGTMLPALAVSGSGITEPASGIAQLPFTISLSKASPSSVSVAYTTANGTAVAGIDYQADSGTLTFTPGTTSQTIDVPVYGGVIGHSSKILTLNLSGPSGATIANGSATGQITDDISGMTLPSLSVAGSSLTEPDSGTSQLAFTVTLSAQSTSPVIVAYATSDGTATAGSDYQAASGTLTFVPGTTSRTVNITIDGGIIGNSSKTLTLKLSAPSGATITNGSAIGTIVDDIAGPLPPTLIVTSSAVTEPDSGTAELPFTVTLSAASASTVTVAYATSDGTATGGSDYQPASGTLTFTPGTTSQTVNVPVYNGIFGTAQKTLTLTLSSPSGATIAAPSATGTIIDDITGTALPQLTITADGADEPVDGTNELPVIVTLSAASASPVTVTYASSDISAIAGFDYQAVSGTLTFPPATTSETINVTIYGGVRDDGDLRNFLMVIASPTGATIAVGASYATIVDLSD
jgi:chitinase